MLKFKELNFNPNNFITTDCIARVLCYCLGMTWEAAITAQCTIAKNTYYSFDSFEVLQTLLGSFGFIGYIKLNTDATVKDLDCVIATNFREANLIVALTDGHCLVVDGDYYIDAEDTGSLKVLGYYYKQR